MLGLFHTGPRFYILILGSKNEELINHIYINSTGGPIAFQNKRNQNMSLITLEKLGYLSKFSCDFFLVKLNEES